MLLKHLGDERSLDHAGKGRIPKNLHALPGLTTTSCPSVMSARKEESINVRETRVRSYP